MFFLKIKQQFNVQFTYLLSPYKTINMKKGLAFVLAVLGAVALIFGVYTLFSGGATGSQGWIATILGGVFFTSGIGLMKTTKGQSAENNS